MQNEQEKTLNFEIELKDVDWLLVKSYAKQIKDDDEIAVLDGLKIVPIYFNEDQSKFRNLLNGGIYDVERLDYIPRSWNNAPEIRFIRLPKFNAKISQVGEVFSSKELLIDMWKRTPFDDTFKAKLAGESLSKNLTNTVSRDELKNITLSIEKDMYILEGLPFENSQDLSISLAKY